MTLVSRLREKERKIDHTHLILLRSILITWQHGFRIQCEIYVKPVTYFFFLIFFRHGAEVEKPPKSSHLNNGLPFGWCSERLTNRCACARRDATAAAARRGPARAPAPRASSATTPEQL